MLNTPSGNILNNIVSSRSMSVYSAKNLLSAENRRRCITMLKSVSQIRMSAEEPAERSAVLIPLCMVEDDVSLLYTVRSLKLTKHRGQVCFPGGKEDKSDTSLEETALRETEEELGIPRRNIDIWGSGKSIIGRFPPSVLPVVGYIKDFDKLTLNINEKEVEKVFTVPLKYLCDCDNIGHTQFRYYSTPVYMAGEERIWGLTALITHVFLNCLIPENGYKYKLKFVRPLQKPLKASL
uniref:Putative peroxisomal nudix hydrolase n=1 Tax=Xenopsylla cheopis TaxID=163159 RepID=A0A6M2DG02_XENCH